MSTFCLGTAAEMNAAVRFKLREMSAEVFRCHLSGVFRGIGYGNGTFVRKSIFLPKKMCIFVLGQFHCRRNPCLDGQKAEYP